MSKLKSVFSDPLSAFSWFVMLTVLLTPTVIASGSISTGGSGVSQYGQMYKQGKRLFFTKVACNRPACPMTREQLSGASASSLVESLRTRAELKLESSDSDAIIGVLCPGEKALNCAGQPDEQEMVQYYLTRRFNIKG